MRSFIPSTPLAAFLLFGLTSIVSAKSGWGEACSQANSHLDSDTWALITDCDATTYCNANGTCAYKGCRKDIYPYGYAAYSYDQLPPLCPQGQFCPDEGDQCISQVPIGGACQKNRDDECQQPSNYKELASTLNINGTVCLNYICYLANVTLGQTCVVDNTVFVAYSDDGGENALIVSRDNCLKGYYCDGSSLQCYKDLAVGQACSGNKECSTYNCQSNGKCGRAADDPIHPKAWTYVLVALGIILLIGGIMTALWLTHRRTRQENQIKLEQYYNEQIAYRQSIMSMSHAKNSLLSLPANTTPELARQSLYRDDAGAYSPTTEGLLPPNMRRDSTSGWSDADRPSDLPRHDSDVLLMNEGRYSDAPNRRGQTSRFRG